MSEKKIFSVGIIIFLSLILVFSVVRLAKAGLVPEEDCTSLYQRYRGQIDQYDLDKDGKISRTEVLGALEDWLTHRLNSEQFLGILSFFRQNCTAGIGIGQQNDPVSGTLTASSQNVGAGETITLTVIARDQNGVSSIWIQAQGRWQSQDCGNVTQCTKNLTVSEPQPGSYGYWGYVYGRRPDGSKEEAWTSPSFVTVTVREIGDITLPPVTGQIQLPQCPFSDSPGIWAKPKDCGWGSKVLLGSGGRISCRTWLILEHITADYTPSTPGLVQTIGPAAVGEGTDLCKIEPVSLEGLPRCPFSGTTGEVWAKPRFRDNVLFEWTWDKGRCKLGEDCSVKNTVNIGQILQGLQNRGLISGYTPGQTVSINVDFNTIIKGITGLDLSRFGIDFGWIVIALTPRLEMGPELYTHSSDPGRAWCGMWIPPILTGSLPCDFCVVR